MNIILVRHGETDSNNMKFIIGHTDIQLNTTGKYQSILCGKYLANNFPNISAIYSSNLLRVRETTELIFKK